MTLQPVTPAAKDFAAYKGLIDLKLFNEIKRLARPLQDKRVLHINTSSSGGGVAQLLQSVVPLSRDLGIDAHWQVLDGGTDFFNVTKKIHNALQGSSVAVSTKEWQLYDQVNQAAAKKIIPAEWDYIFIHDPQPAAIRQYMPGGRTIWLWRCHLDLSAPDPKVTAHFLDYLNDYAGYIFSLKSYVWPHLVGPQTRVVPVGIDPLSAKNVPLDLAETKRIVAGFGVDPSKPLVVQVSRFDLWKDPLGVIKAYRLARKKLPTLQLVLMGDEAADDPNGRNMLEKVVAEAKSDKQIFIITDSDDRAVNAFQTVANVVLQKSLREGFGLTVTEALWKKTPVIGGEVGGIPLQVKDGHNGYLVSSPLETAKYIVRLAANPVRAQQMGQWGREYVRRHFLLPHMMAAEMKFMSDLTPR